MEKDNYPIPPEDNEFCIALVKAVPALTPVMQKHLEDECGEILSYMFLADVARWAEANAAERKETIRQIVATLNEGLEHGEGDVPNLVAVGFGESISVPSPLAQLLSDGLKEQYDSDLRRSMGPHPPDLLWPPMNPRRKPKWIRLLRFRRK